MTAAPDEHGWVPVPNWNMESLRDHIQTQLQRISSENEIRMEALQAELDRRFDAMQLQMDQRFTSSEQAVKDALIAADKAVQAALKSAETAVNKAEVAAEKRFESVNEFRQTLTDQTASFVTQDRYDGLAQQVTSLNSRVDNMAGSEIGVRASQLDSRQVIIMVVMIISVLIALISVIAFVLKH